MMEVIGDDPVLWIDVKTMKERGHYASENMRLFNQALAKAHARHPALRGVRLVGGRQGLVVHGRRHPLHLDGYAYRAALIADAVAEAFPADDLGADDLDRRDRPAAQKDDVDSLRSPVQMLPAPRMVSIIRRMPSPVRCIAS